jgi:protein gp37
LKSFQETFYTAAWNPLEGCLGSCRYCRSREEAERNGGHRSLASYMAQDSPVDTRKLRILEFPIRDELTGQAETYPFLFSPTYHRHHLASLPTKSKPENILVCGKGDLFGDWITDWIIDEVFSYALSINQHNYLFITKNPARYDTVKEKQENMFFGATVDTQERADFLIASKVSVLDYLCIEPILSAIDFNGILTNCPSRIKWVIIGSESGNSIGKIYPKREWITGIAETCTSWGIPVFMLPGQSNNADKRQLIELLGAEFRQEYPPEIKRNLRT